MELEFDADRAHVVRIDSHQRGAIVEQLPYPGERASVGIGGLEEKGFLDIDQAAIAVEPVMAPNVPPFERGENVVAHVATLRVRREHDGAVAVAIGKGIERFSNREE